VLGIVPGKMEMLISVRKFREDGINKKFNFNHCIYLVQAAHCLSAPETLVKYLSVSR
jgi:hypothetical protein